MTKSATRGSAQNGLDVSIRIATSRSAQIATTQEGIDQLASQTFGTCLGASARFHGSADGHQGLSCVLKNKGRAMIRGYAKGSTNDRARREDGGEEVEGNSFDKGKGEVEDSKFELGQSMDADADKVLTVELSESLSEEMRKGPRGDIPHGNGGIGGRCCDQIEESNSLRACVECKGETRPGLQPMEALVIGPFHQWMHSS